MGSEDLERLKMTRVTVRLGFVRNLGNYETARVDLGVEDDVRESETVDQATNRVYDFVEKKLIEKVTELEKELE